MYYKNKIKLKTQSSQWHVMPEILITFQELVSNAKDRLSNTKIPNSNRVILLKEEKGCSWCVRRCWRFTLLGSPAGAQPPRDERQVPFVHHLASSAFSLQASPLPWRFPQPLGLSQLSWFSSILRNMFRKRTETKKLWSKNPCREVNTARRAFRRASHTLRHYFQSP